MQTRRAIIVRNPCSYPIRLRRRLRCLRFGLSERKFQLRSPSVYLFMCLCRMRWVHSGSLSSLCALFSHDFARGTPPSSVYSPYRSVFYSFIRQTGYFFFSPLYFIRSSHSHPPLSLPTPVNVYAYLTHPMHSVTASLDFSTSLSPFEHHCHFALWGARNVHTADPSLFWLGIGRWGGFPTLRNIFCSLYYLYYRQHNYNIYKVLYSNMFRLSTDVFRLY